MQGPIIGGGHKGGHAAIIKVVGMHEAAQKGVKVVDVCPSVTEPMHARIEEDPFEAMM